MNAPPLENSLSPIVEFRAQEPRKTNSATHDQLTKWHDLMESDVISKEEYKEMHTTIMNDIKRF